MIFYMSCFLRSFKSLQERVEKFNKATSLTLAQAFSIASKRKQVNDTGSIISQVKTKKKK